MINQTPMRTDQPYFATLPPEDLGKEILLRCNAYYAHPTVQAQLWRMRLAWNYYYGYDEAFRHGTSSVGRGGSEGQLAFMRVNTLRRVSNASVAQILGRQVEWDPVASSYTSSGVNGVRKGKALLKDQWRRGGGRREYALAVDSARYRSEGFIHTKWVASAGEPIGATDDMAARTGRVVYTSPAPWAVVRNPVADAASKCNWWVVVEKENRFELAETPEYIGQREQIMNSSASLSSDWFNFGILNVTTTWDDDEIPILYFYHRPTAAVPLGMRVKVLVDGTVLGWPKPLVSDEIPLRRIVPAELDSTPFGYTEFFDGIAAQQIIDHLHSSAATNYGAFARQVIAMKRGRSAEVQRLTDLAILWYDDKDSMPQGINLTAMAQGWLQYLEVLGIEIQQTLGQNQVTMGQSPGDRAPASLGALLAAQSAQGGTKFLESCEDAVMGMGRDTLAVFRANAMDPIAVRTDDGFESVTAEDVADLKDVSVDLSSEMANSKATRLQIAEMLANVPDPKTRDELMQFIETGRNDAMTDPVEKQYERVLRENEMIKRGELPTVSPADHDTFHGINHTIPMLDGPERDDPRAMMVWNIHMCWHYQQEYGVPTRTRPQDGEAFVREIGMDPMYPMRMRALMGKPPPLMMAPPPAPAGAAPGPGGSPEKPSEPTPGTNPSQLPPLPKNAATGRTATPGDWGGTPTPGAN